MISTDLFYKDKKSSDGLYGRCKQCSRIVSRQSYQIHRDRKTRHQSEYYQKNKEVVDAKRMIRLKNDRSKHYAHRAVYLAVKSGVLQKGICSICGDKDTVAHHEDYNKRLEVIWLCPTHHMRLHSERRLSSTH